MIISHSHKFLFIAYPKCASSYIQKILNPHGKRNIKIKGVPCNNHINISELKPVADRRNWNISEYFKFTSIRNPWDRVVSLYHYCITKEKAFLRTTKIHPSFNKKTTFQEWLLMPTFNADIRYFSNLNNTNFMDFVIKVENMDDDLKTVCDIIKIPFKKTAKVNKTEHKHYSHYYTSQDMIDYVADKFKNDIELGNYQFEEK